MLREESSTDEWVNLGTYGDWRIDHRHGVWVRKGIKDGGTYPHLHL
jgi:hypothetical protein